MADNAGGSRREQLREDFHGQTARIAFSELQRYFAAGKLVLVGESLDLVEVAVELALDNRERFEEWLGQSAISTVTDDQARTWLDDDAQLWAVVADPWVLVQEWRAPTG